MIRSAHRRKLRLGAVAAVMIGICSLVMLWWVDPVEIGAPGGVLGIGDKECFGNSRGVSIVQRSGQSANNWCEHCGRPRAPRLVGTGASCLPSLRAAAKTNWPLLDVGRY
jgi:hypothetical protein